MFPKNLLKGSSPDIAKTNMRTMKKGGQSEIDATKNAIKASSVPTKKVKGHPNRHKNLGTFLHKKVSGAVPQGMPIANDVQPIDSEPGE